jgi:hypothetical protein
VPFLGLSQKEVVRWSGHPNFKLIYHSEKEKLINMPEGVVAAVGLLFFGTISSIFHKISEHFFDGWLLLVFSNN